MSEQYVITDLSIDGVQVRLGDPIPERTPIGPFATRGDAWDYARRMQVRYGHGGGSVSVSVLHQPEGDPNE